MSAVQYDYLAMWPCPGCSRAIERRDAEAIDVHRKTHEYARLAMETAVRYDTPYVYAPRANVVLGGLSVIEYGPQSIPPSSAESMRNAAARPGRMYRWRLRLSVCRNPGWEQREASAMTDAAEWAIDHRGAWQPIEPDPYMARGRGVEIHCPERVMPDAVLAAIKDAWLTIESLD